MGLKETNQRLRLRKIWALPQSCTCLYASSSYDLFQCGQEGVHMRRPLSSRQDAQAADGGACRLRQQGQQIWGYP